MRLAKSTSKESTEALINALTSRLDPKKMIEDSRFQLTQGRDFRMEIIDTSILIEGFTSDMLRQMLQLDRKESVVFGRSSQAMPFGMKINLLLDIEILDAAVKSKFDTFISLRNQVAHNPDNPTVLSMIQQSGKKKESGAYERGAKYLLGHYKELKDESEDGLRIALSLLCQDVLEITYGIRERILNDRLKFVAGAVGYKWMTVVENRLVPLREELTLSIQKRLTSGASITSKEILEIPERMEAYIRTELLEIVSEDTEALKSRNFDVSAFGPLERRKMSRTQLWRMRWKIRINKGLRSMMFDV